MSLLNKIKNTYQSIGNRFNKVLTSIDSNLNNLYLPVKNTFTSKTNKQEYTNHNMREPKHIITYSPKRYRNDFIAIIMCILCSMLPSSIDCIKTYSTNISSKNYLIAQINNDSNISSSENKQDIFYTLLESTHVIKKGEHLTAIAKQYLPENSDVKSLNEKIRLIQRLNIMSPNKENDYVIGKEGKIMPGNDGLIDCIYSGDTLIVKVEQVKHIKKNNKSDNKKNLSDVNLDNMKNTREKSFLKEHFENNTIIKPEYISSDISMKSSSFEHDISPNQKNSIKKSPHLQPKGYNIGFFANNKIYCGNNSSDNRIKSQTNCPHQSELNKSKSSLELEAKPCIIPKIILTANNKLPFNREYRKILNMYNSNKHLKTITNEIKKINTSENLEEKILTYLERGVQKNVAYRTRFNRQYSTKLNMDSTLKSMLISNSSYKSIQNYVRNKGMNISNSTICRMKKSVKA